MQIDSSTGNTHPQREAAAASRPVHGIDQQRLRILRCTARAMVTGAGGLRFKAGTRPWLEGLAEVPQPAAIRINIKKGVLP